MPGQGFPKGSRVLGQVTQVNASDGTIIVEPVDTSLPITPPASPKLYGKGFPRGSRVLGQISQFNVSDGTLIVEATDVDNYIPLPASPVEGDLLYYHSGAWARLPVGSGSQVLGISGGDPAWVTDPGGGGGVHGLTSAQQDNTTSTIATNTNTDINTLSVTIPVGGAVTFLFGEFEVVPPGNCAGNLNLVVDGVAKRTMRWHSESTSSRFMVSVFLGIVLTAGSHTVKLNVSNDALSSGSIVAEFGQGLEIDYLT